jgi:chromosome segregation protein
MYLKRLEIQGFKSFADNTVVEFLPPKNGNFSITAIVGPNGSGKSNITDAMRWVMGEQSMKTIRSKKSEDVIFSGSESRGAMSLAEVCMVLDNPNDVVDIGAEEIRIVRRLYRSGESEYLINNNPSRLLDIHLLIAKAQFAEHAYSIVSQGMIDRLLTVSPQERKDFFDEASGIKELQIKRHQSFLKMQRTTDHLKQAETIMQEIEPRLKLLSRQVKKLEEREEVERELVGVQESYYFTIFSKHKQEMDALQEATKTIENKYRAAFEELESIQTELADLAHVSTRQEVFDQLQSEFQNLVREKNGYEREQVILEGQMHTEYSNVGKQNIGWLESKITETKQVQNSRTEELNKLYNDSKRLLSEMAIQKKQLEEITLEKNQLSLKISRLQNELLKDQSEQQFRDFSGLTAVKAVLDRKKEFGTIYGLVPELGKVEEEYRLALEVAAGAHMTSIVVQDETVARRAIEYLRRERLGTATFLPLSKIQGRLLSRDEESLLQEGAVIDSSLNLIKFEEKFRPIFSFIFGSTLVVKDLAAAEAVGIGRARMVTLLGDIAEKNGVMRGGFRQRRQNIGFASELGLDRADRLEEFRQDISNEQEKISSLEKKKIAKDTRIAQIVFQKYCIIDFFFADGEKENDGEKEPSVERVGGFGSTGI